MRESERVKEKDTVAHQRDALIFAWHYLNGTGITSTFTAVTTLPAILVVTITAAASVSMYGGDCAQFIPKLLATDIRKAVTATMVLYPLIYGLLSRGGVAKTTLNHFCAPRITGIYRVSPNARP